MSQKLPLNPQPASRRDKFIVAGLLLLPFILFWKQTFGISAFYIYDLQYYFFPYRKVAADILWSGHLPLWNPYTCGGMPLLGDGQVGILYPPNWLFLILRPEHALSLAILSSFAIAGLGMYRFLKLFEFDDAPCVLSSLSFMFSGYLVAHLVHASIAATAAWVPWVFWGMERFIRRPNAKRFVVAAICPAIQALCGHPQVPIYTALAAGLYVLTISISDLFETRRAKALLPLCTCLAAYLVGYLLAAIQLVPWIELSRFSPRAAGTSFALFSMDSLHGIDWLMLLFPYAFGGMQTSWMQSLEPLDFGVVIYAWERLPYVGLIPLALAAVGVTRIIGKPGNSPRSRLIALTVVLLVMLLIAAGDSTPFSKLIYQLPAIGRLRGQARAMGVGVFAISALSAFGLAWLTSKTPSEKQSRADLRMLILGIALPLAVGGVLLYAATTDPTKLAEQSQFVFGTVLGAKRTNAIVPLILAVLGGAALVWRAISRGRGASIAVLALLAITGFDVIALATTFNSTVDSEAFRDVPGVVDFLKQDTDPYRVAVFTPKHDLLPREARAQLAVSWAMPFGLEDVNGFNSLQPRRIVDFLTSAANEDITYGYLGPSLLTNEVRRLTQMGARYAVLQQPYTWPAASSWKIVYQDGYVTVGRNPENTDRAVFAELVLARRDSKLVLERVHDPEFDPSRYAIVESEMSREETTKLSVASPARVTVKRVSPNELRLTAHTTEPRLLVVRETYFPGWQAETRRADSNDAWTWTQIFPTNYVHRGVLVPAGETEIRMVYRPLSVSVGVAVTTATALGCAGLVFLSRWRKRKT